MDTWLPIINLAITAALFGLIWVVQLVHYPGFAYVDKLQFSAFHTLHTRQISFFVAPLMVIELLVVLLMLFFSSNGWAYWLQLILVLFLWGSTFIIQVPMHARLASGKDMKNIRQLTKTNWIRTFLWSIKLFLALYLIT